MLHYQGVFVLLIFGTVSFHVIAETSSLSLEAEIIGPQTIKPLMEAYIKLIVTNISDKPIYITTFRPDDHNLIYALRHGDSTIPVKTPRESILPASNRWLDPDESYSMPVRFAYDWAYEHFYFTDPGRYTFQATILSPQRYPESGFERSKISLSSNILDITVLPPTAEEEIQLEELKAINAWHYTYSFLEIPYGFDERRRITEQAVEFYTKYPTSIYSAELLYESAGFFYKLRFVNANISQEEAEVPLKKYWNIMMDYVTHPHAKAKVSARTSMQNLKDKYIQRFGVFPEDLPEIP